MKLGFVSFSSDGHLNPSMTLANAIASRGHEVVLYTLADGIRKTTHCNFETRCYGAESLSAEEIARSYREVGELTGMRAVRYTVDLFRRRACVGLREFPRLFRDDQIEGLVIDQVVSDAAVVARAEGIPFVTVSNALPTNLDPSIPPVFSHLGPVSGPLDKLRTLALNQVFHSLAKPVLQSLNQFQLERRLPAYKSIAEIGSELAQVVQLPASLDFPRTRLPQTFHYTGPFHDAAARSSVEFPWDRISSERPLIYASMGTLQNQNRHLFYLFAQACETLPVQLVISLGGSTDAEQFHDLPGDPVVVRYAPQLELIKRSTLCITHGGLNTALESLAQGVPMLAIPVTNDQPGVAARIQWRQVGRMLALRKLSLAKMRAMLEELLREPRYAENARTMQREIASTDGLALAAKMIEKAISTGKPVHRAS